MDEKKKRRVLRESVRHYYEFEQLFVSEGTIVISHAGLDISFLDLKDALEKLSPRKQEAIYYNVILDMKQKDVAEKMGITTVSVGQYVESGFSQIAKEYFPDGNEQKEPRKRRRKKSDG
jgi:DNA-directed RNA polymerase specialized sigma24 family protein